MSDSPAAAYDALPYHHGSVPETHPARLGAIARMLGIDAAPPDRCRVLEFGCAEGMNLLPLAERLPGSTFVGVDFSPVQVRTAEQARVAAGINNARFVCADIRTFEPEAGAFDYVIAHGVYSWVPAEVRERLLALCARALAPAGVAYVSYNVYPAWGMLGGLRAMLRAEMAGAEDPPAHLARLFPLLQKAFAGDSSPYATWMREELALMQAKPLALLMHDDLAPDNDPVTFLEFTAHAARHGLSYLAEAHFPSMPTEHLPPPARGALAELAPDFFSRATFSRSGRQSSLSQQPAPARHNAGETHARSRSDPAMRRRSCICGRWMESSTCRGPNRCA
ncbi:MAG: class I SAM-dependent methyltransferase [Chthoniobacter sp.]